MFGTGHADDRLLIFFTMVTYIQILARTVFMLRVLLSDQGGMIDRTIVPLRPSFCPANLSVLAKALAINKLVRYQQ